VDEEFDGPGQIDRKIRTLTKAILPAGTDDTAIVAVQNLIHRDGIFARLADVSAERADFLADRVVSGPIPAIEGLEVAEQDGRWVITAGRATWVGQDIAACQAIIDTEGISAFRMERQHEVDDPDGGMWTKDFPFRRCDPHEVPDLVSTAVWVDPAVTNTDRSDSMGIQVDGLAYDNTLYRLYSWEGRTSPEDALRRAIRKAVEVGADAVGVETDQGGDTWISVYNAALETVRVELIEEEPDRLVRWPRFRSRKAGEGYGPKAHRAQQMLSGYETRPGVVHVRGTHEILERGLKRFGVRKPYDLVDAAFWSWWDLIGHKGPQVAVGWATVENRDPVWDDSARSFTPDGRTPARSMPMKSLTDAAPPVRYVL
jgi:hypothetical protein